MKRTLSAIMKRTLSIFVILLSFIMSMCKPSATSVEPPNGTGILVQNGSTVIFSYGGAEIMTLETDIPSSGFTVRELKEERDGRVSHLFTVSSISGGSMTIKGTIRAGSESFACEADRRIEGTQVVRHTYGPSHSLLNRAVYDRQSDWLLSADHSYTSASLKIDPLEADSSGVTYALSMTGNEVTFRFRPRYYQLHRGLRYFEPWTYEVWKEPVAGWCSWFAYKTAITEENVREAADVIAETMLPYGLDYLQIDDGYQQSGGSPDTWITPNEKFPSGLDSLAAYISSRGLKPGIWTNVAVHDSAWVYSHQGWFVRNNNGTPASGRWIGYVLNGLEDEMLDSVITPVYSRFRNDGWRYFKLDALRHLLFEGYNSHSSFFSGGYTAREEAFRNLVRKVREETGPENFLLACWGVLPGVVGLADGCRIGNDGYGYTALAQYNSFNNVVWRNDPDHIELTPQEAYRSCMATSLTGSLFMVTDKPEVYRTDLIAPARKSLPMLFTLPGQVFDLDPSRSAFLDRTTTEMSGSGERESDGSRTSPFDLFMLELNLPWERWCVLGRLGEKEKEISLGELGLEQGKPCLLYEFWSDTFLGTVTDRILFDSPDPKYNCQLFCIRPAQQNPQVLATSRHISCGASDLSDITWKDGVLSGVSRTVANDTYTLIIHEPAGYSKPSVTATGGKIITQTVEENVRRISMVSPDGALISWKIDYSSGISR
jgi:alpha-galactosidase